MIRARSEIHLFCSAMCSAVLPPVHPETNPDNVIGLFTLTASGQALRRVDTTSSGIPSFCKTHSKGTIPLPSTVHRFGCVWKGCNESRHHCSFWNAVVLQHVLQGGVAACVLLLGSFFLGTLRTRLKPALRSAVLYFFVEPSESAIKLYLFFIVFFRGYAAQYIL